MRFLHRLRHHVAHRHREVLALMTEKRILDEHPRDRAERLLPHLALVRARDVEAAQLQRGRRLAGAKLDATAAHQIKRRDPLRNARRMIVPRRQQRDSVAESNLLRPLAGSRQKNLRRGRMSILFEKVMLDFPHVVDAELVGELDLVECVPKQLQLRSLCPRTRQLMLIKSSQLHFFSTIFSVSIAAAVWALASLP